MESTVLDALIGAIADAVAARTIPQIDKYRDEDRIRQAEEQWQAANVTPCLWLTRTEAARMLGISTKTLDRGVKHGTLPQPVHMYGSTLRWSRADIEAMGRP